MKRVVVGVIIGAAALSLETGARAEPPLEPVKVRVSKLEGIPDQARVKTRLIGAMTKGNCPAETIIGKWHVEPLFTGTSVPGELRRFCVFEWKGDGEPTKPAKLMERTEGLGEDLQVVAALGSPVLDQSKVWRALEAAYFDQIDAQMGAGGSNLIATPSEPWTPVRVEVIDSAPALNVDRADQLRHGETLARLIGRMTSRRNTTTGAIEATVATIEKRLALDVGSELVVNNGVTVGRKGGFYGTHSRLARAIYEALEGWDPSNQKLIINLSIGWEGRYNGPGSELSGGAAGVYAALRAARCRGALVIAAAGNTSDGPEPDDGPLFPAAWEREAAPDATACQATRYGWARTGTAAIQSPKTGKYNPLLWAIGGVDGADRKLVNARPGGRPRLAAPGAFMVVGDENGKRSEMLTGTSVAAASTSATAALIWAYRPEMSPAEVMDEIYESGVDLGVVADFCTKWSSALPAKPGQPTICSSIRRVSACLAVTSVCPIGSPKTCPKPLPVRCNLPERQDRRPKQIAVTLPQNTPLHSYSRGGDVKLPRLCRSKTLTSIAGTQPCPAEQYPNRIVVPFTGPQPGADPCNVCDYDVNSETLAITINDQLADGVSDGVITFFDAQDEVIGTFELPDQEIRPGKTVIISNLVLPNRHLYAAPYRARISFAEPATSTSRSDAVLIYNDTTP